MRDDVLTSVRNPRVQAVVALHDARERRRQGLHLAEGLRVCRDALAAAEVVELLHTGGHDELVGAASRDVRVTRVDDRVMARLSDAVTPPGIVAVVRTPDVTRPLPPRGPVLVLDGVGDPGNVGTLLRTAAAFGAAVLSLGGADPFGPKAVRASAGTVYRTSVHRLDPDALDADVLRGEGRPVLGLAADGTRTLVDAAREVPEQGVVLVVGSEPHGVGAAARASIDRMVRIPMRSDVESLNVAAAAAIAMHALMPV